MKTKGIITSIIIALIAVVGFTAGTGCANIIPPEGGVRDSLPPRLIKAEPGDSALNFNGNKVTLIFDEFVEVQNVSENLIFSPTPSVNPYVEYKLKTVTVKLKDSLVPNTTYTINFGNSIKDFTEGNPFKNFTYTFSTGNYIDSLELSGKVVLAENGKLDTTMIVMLHTSPEDSVVVKQKPLYISKLDGNGNFRFKNLPPKTFYLFALKDESNTRRYTSEKSLFAFADKPIVVQSSIEPITLYAYVAKEGLEQQKQTNTNANRRAGPADKRLKYQSTITGGQQDILSDFYITVPLPLKTFDSTKLTLFTDSIFAPVTDYSFSKDSTGTKINLTHKWKENTLYHLILDKDFAEDSSGNKLMRTDTLSFTTKKLSDYGSLKLKLRNLALEKNPVLQIVSNNIIVRSVPMKSIDLTIDLFVPGEYELRILYDINSNGVWDPGDFFGKHLQPEIVVPVERKISIKAAWKNEFEIIL
ncbi:MAG: Ig-like domain-containing protein [Chitinophagaceae bacterium]